MPPPSPDEIIRDRNAALWEACYRNETLRTEYSLLAEKYEGLAEAFVDLYRAAADSKDPATSWAVEDYRHLYRALTDR